jgi:hypothetical protein
MSYTWVLSTLSCVLALDAIARESSCQNLPKLSLFRNGTHGIAPWVHLPLHCTGEIPGQRPCVGKAYSSCLRLQNLKLSKSSIPGGNPTLAVTARLINGVRATAKVPSGALTGKRECVEAERAGLSASNLDSAIHMIIDWSSGNPPHGQDGRPGTVQAWRSDQSSRCLPRPPNGSSLATDEVRCNVAIFKYRKLSALTRLSGSAYCRSTRMPAA